MRSIWTGSITFGLITIPVKLYTAVSDDRVHFSMLHEKDGAHIKYQHVCEKEGTEVPWDEIVKGYEVSSGQFVTFTKEELSALDVHSMRTIDIDTFVALDDIDPIYYDSSYYVAPQEGAGKAYNLLVTALSEQERVGIAKFAMRDKEHLCALRVRDGMFVLETMHWPSEVREPDFPLYDDESKVREREVQMAMNLVDQLTGPFEPERYTNEFEQHVKQAAERKLEGEEITVTEDAPEKTPADDLMKMLEASLDAARTGKAGPGKRGSAGGSKARRPAGSRRSGHTRTELRGQSRSELYELAQAQEIDGRSDMTKDQLVDALAK